MTEQNKIHHATRKAADMSLARREISPQSHAAIMEGRLSLAEAKELGRSGTPMDTSGTDSGPASATGTPGAGSPQDGPDAPPQPVSRISKGDRSRECMCGCGERTVGGRFRMGHDMRLHTYAKEYLRGERELSPEQLSYIESSSKLERARQQIEKEERKLQERIAAKSERQRKREGAEAARKRNQQK